MIILVDPTIVTVILNLLFIKCCIYNVDSGHMGDKGCWTASQHMSTTSTASKGNGKMAGIVMYICKYVYLKSRIQISFRIT